MDIRQAIASHSGLLVTSLSSSQDFMYHLLEKQLIEHYQLKKHRELETTIKRTDDLINLVCKRASHDLAKEFMQWLQSTKQQQIFDAINSSSQSTTSLTTTDSIDLSHSSASEEDDGESECESLGVNTTPILDIKGTIPTQEFVDEKLSDAMAVYPLSTPSRGVAMLVINSMFQSKPASHNREGSNFDTIHLTKLFTWLGYEVRVFSNTSKADFLSRLHALTRDRAQRSFSSFVLCLLSRGGVGSVTMSDNSEIYTDEITDRLDSNNFPAMAGKPKFIYIDVNGPDLDSDSGLVLPKSNSNIGYGHTGLVDHIQINRYASNERADVTRRVDPSTLIIDESLSSVACKADFVIYLASFPRYSALHNSRVGSIATRVIVEVFYKHAHKCHISDLAMKIRRKLSSKDLLGKKQVLTTIDTLNKDFYIFPVIPTTSS